MPATCKAIGCVNEVETTSDYCWECNDPKEKEESLSKMYPKYYKDVGDLTSIDVYAVHMLFDIQDASGAIQHASKKLLLSGVRTGNKSAYKDIQEARDTLTRWLQLHPHLQ